MRETLLDPTTPSQIRLYLRWIPYERLANIQQIEESDYAIVYKATWLDCYTLADYLSRGRVTLTILHGITQDPKTKEYLIVMDYGTRGDLKNHLKCVLHEVLWGNKVEYLYDLSRQLYGIHKTGTVHCNLHSGNIVISDISFSILDSERHAYFIGFRHSCPENTTVSDVHGVLPYVAPEILRKQPYTTTTDIYSFGVVMCEL
ncbi:kinase-like domain-containing protein, partial [Glomus cerebriforme]